MIANTLEYLYANAQILEIKEMIEKDCFLDELNPINHSDIVNLGLDLLRIFIEIHHVPLDNQGQSNNEDLIENIKNLSESPLAFLHYANDTIISQRTKNETLQDVLLAIETIDDKELLINKILSREILK